MQHHNAPTAPPTFFDLIVSAALGKDGTARTLRMEYADEEGFFKKIDAFLARLVPALVNQAQVDRTMINAMIIAHPVPRDQAARVLAAFTEMTGKQATLETANIPVDPCTEQKVTLMQIRDQHHFDIVDLANQARVHPDTVYSMLLQEPVPRDCALMVLHALSGETGSIYTLENVDVPLLRV